MALLSGKGMVLLEKDGTRHEFALESVPIWERRGWKVVDPEKVQDDPDRKRRIELSKKAAEEQAKATENAANPEELPGFGENK